MHGELIFLRLVHIVGGVFWVGSLLFMTIFLLPVLKETSPASAHVMMGLQRRRMTMWLPIAAIVTMLAGLRLMMIVSNNFSRAYFMTPSGKGFAVAAILAILGFLIGVIVARPGANRMTELSSIAVSDEINRDRIKAEILALQKRVALSSNATTFLLLLSAIGMAISRYL